MENNTVTYIPTSSLLAAASLLRAESKRLRGMGSNLSAGYLSRSKDFDSLAEELENR